LRSDWDDDRPATTILRARAYLLGYPADDVTWARLGCLLAGLARYEEARAALATGARIWEGREHRPLAFLLVWIGDSYEREGDFPAAEIWYRRAVEAAPDHQVGYGCLGRLLCRWGRLAEAEAIGQRAVRCDRGLPEQAWLELGFVLRAQGRYAEAARCFRKSLAFDPDGGAAKLALADVEAAQRCERHGIWREGRGEAYERMRRQLREGMPAQNALLARRYLEECPHNFAVWTSLGQELSRLCRHEEARVALARGAGLADGEGRTKAAWINDAWTGRAYERCGNYTAAESWYRRAIQTAPDNASGYVFLGALLAHWGRFDEAAVVHRGGTTCATGRVDESWLNLGYVLRAQERFGDALVCFREVLRIGPDYEVAKQAIDDVKAAMTFKR
jgi:tetratricopeptide (TPR) repeat protein